MGVIQNLTALLIAVTAAARAFPLWLSWRLSSHLETIEDEIISLEASAHSADRPKLDRLRVKQANGRVQYAALLSIINLPQVGSGSKDH
jgi:hypothetical protein